MAYFNTVKRMADVCAMPLVLIGLVGGILSPAFGDPAEAKSASPVSSSSTVLPDQNAMLLDATQNLVQALVKSVQQASAAPQVARAAASPVPQRVTPSASERATQAAQAVQTGRADQALAAVPQDDDGAARAQTIAQGLAAQPWHVPRGAQLQTVLTDWCHRAGWTLVWQSEYSYRIEADANFGGNFVDAVTAMFTAMSNVTPTIYPEIYKGNRVVLVKNSPTH